MYTYLISHDYINVISLSLTVSLCSFSLFFSLTSSSFSLYPFFLQVTWRATSYLVLISLLTRHTDRRIQGYSVIVCLSYKRAPVGAFLHFALLIENPSGLARVQCSGFKGCTIPRCVGSTICMQCIQALLC